MNKFIGKICPFCKTEFKENDDIVVCASCDMPHHKDCWVENQGCTTFGCIGTIEVANNSSNTVTATEFSYEDTTENSYIFCTKCGAKNADSFAFCSKCGNALKTVAAVNASAQSRPSYNTQQSYNQVNTVVQGTYITQTQTVNNSVYNNGQQNNNTSQSNIGFGGDVEAMVRKNYGYYIPRFQKIKSSNNRISWNPGSFFFGAYWFLYRKMYAYGFAFLAASIVVSLIDTPIVYVVFYGASIAVSLFANYIYLLWIESNVAKAKTLSEPDRAKHIKQHSGVSSVVPVAAFFLCAVLISVIYNM